MHACVFLLLCYHPDISLTNKPITKVEAVKKVLEKAGGSANWEHIYSHIEKFCPEAKNSNFWQEGIRGVVYREIRYKRNFKMAEKGVVALKA